MEAMFILLVAIGVVVIAMLPTSFYRLITRLFSWGDWGIRKNKRKHDYDDVLADLFLLLSFVFSVFYYRLPWYPILYSVFFWLSYLSMMGQASRISLREKKRSRLSLLLCLSVMAAAAYLSSIGAFNHFHAWLDTTVFRQSLRNGHHLISLYTIKHHEGIVVLLQALLYFFSFYVVWAQFKCLRLEETYKGRNLITFWIKILIISALFILTASAGFRWIHALYFIKY